MNRDEDDDIGFMCPSCKDEGCDACCPILTEHDIHISLHRHRLEMAKLRERLAEEIEALQWPYNLPGLAETGWGYGRDDAARIVRGAPADTDQATYPVLTSEQLQKIAEIPQKAPRRRPADTDPAQEEGT